MNYHQLNVFEAVARHLSYSRAAEELSVSQPAVSKLVHQLELQLGLPLFERTGNRIHLTEAGGLLFDYAKRLKMMEKELTEALDAMKGLSRGSLRLGASSTPGIYIMPGALAIFRQRHPGIQVSLEITNTQRVVRLLLSHDLDLGLTGGPPDSDEVTGVPVIDDTLLLAMAPDHRLAKKHPVTIDDLRGETMILRELGSATREAMERCLRSVAVDYSNSLTLNGMEAVKRAVMSGLGVTLVSRFAVTVEAAQGLMAVQSVEGLNCLRHLYLVHRRQGPSITGAAFVQALQDYLSQIGS